MSTPIITLHWLEASRAQRILWLLEELGVSFNLKMYNRTETNEAPESLKKLYPPGKSPVVEVDYKDGKEPLMIAESAHIVNYLVKNFDKEGKFKPIDEAGELELDFLTNFAEGSAQPFLTFGLVLAFVQASMKDLDMDAISKYNAAIKEHCLMEVDRAFSQLEQKLVKNSKNADEGPFFVQNKFSGADVLMHLSVSLAFRMDLLDGFDGSKYPALKAWLGQVESRPAFKKAIERAESEGKGKFKVMVY